MGYRTRTYLEASLHWYSSLWLQKRVIHIGERFSPLSFHDSSYHESSQAGEKSSPETGETSRGFFEVVLLLPSSSSNLSNSFSASCCVSCASNSVFTRLLRLEVRLLFFCASSEQRRCKRFSISGPREVTSSTVKSAALWVVREPTIRPDAASPQDVCLGPLQLCTVRKTERCKSGRLDLQTTEAMAADTAGMYRVSRSVTLSCCAVSNSSGLVRCKL